MTLDSHDKVVMVGDSVTACGRKTPIGEGVGDALGTGYVLYIDCLRRVMHPEKPVNFINMGIDGNTVRDLSRRWQDDVVDLRPDWVSIMIGINEVWRQFDQATSGQSPVYLDEYRDRLDQLVDRTKQVVKGIILVTPVYLYRSDDDPMRAEVDRYADAMKTVAKKHKTHFVDAQRVIDRMLSYMGFEQLSNDRVHPYPLGHMALANAWLAEETY